MRRLPEAFLILAMLAVSMDIAQAVPMRIAFEAIGALSPKAPAGRVQGRVTLPVGEKPVTSLTVRLQLPFGPARTEPLEATITCPVKEGTVRCETPAGKFDLRLRADGGFAPVYLWGIEVPKGKTADLGELKLRRGHQMSRRTRSS